MSISNVSTIIWNAEKVFYWVLCSV